MIAKNSARRATTSAARAYFDPHLRFLNKHRHQVIFTANVLACLLLLVATLYVTKQANFNHSANSDALIFPYLFKNFSPHDIVVAAHHGNILEFPLYILQALLPYNFITYSTVTIGLNVLTIGCWAALLVWLFGKRYVAVICVILSALLLSSPMFVNNITGNTFRNIEYPLGLGFVILVSRCMRGRLRATWQVVLGTLLFALFSGAVAGDSLLEYCFVLPLFMAVIIMWARGRVNRIQALKSLGLVVGSVICAALIQKLVHWTGIAGYYQSPNFNVHTVPARELSVSITTATQQLLSSFGGYILGIHKVGWSQSIILLNFLILGVVIIHFWHIIRRVSRRVNSSTYQQLDFVLLVLGFSFFLTFIIYILADQVSGSNSRYLSLLPLLGVTAVVAAIKTHFAKNTAVLIGIPIAIVVVLLISLSYVRANQSSATTITMNVRHSIDEAVDAAHRNNVSVLLTGYWYGATTRFWSHDMIMATSVDNCNEALPAVNDRISWYTPNPHMHRSALLVDRSGEDKYFWLQCPNYLLNKTYGSPAKIVYLTGVDRTNNYHRVKDSLQLWIYNYDVRSKVNTANLQRAFGSSTK